MHFNFPGNFKPILWNESIVSLQRKRHFFSKRSQPLARFWVVYAIGFTNLSLDMLI